MTEETKDYAQRVIKLVSDESKTKISDIPKEWTNKDVIEWIEFLIIKFEYLQNEIKIKEAEKRFDIAVV